MGTWKTRGLRGSTLEDMINMTNESYREKGLALIQKIPTPITPINIDQSTRHITLAYFDKQSTVDYIGTVQGIPVCFDAKECAVTTFPMMNNTMFNAFIQYFNMQIYAFIQNYFKSNHTFLQSFYIIILYIFKRNLLYTF